MKCRPYFHPAVTPERPWSLPDLCGPMGYNLPRNLTGGGHIGIVELGGAAFRNDMIMFCGLAGMPVPNIVNPTSPFPSDPQGADVEIALDMQVAAFVNWWCTGQVPTIEMIWDTSGNIYPGVTWAAAAKCDTCSISWGAPENEWGPADAAAMDAAGWAAGASGMAVLAATGDNDFGDGEAGAHVDLPAAAPSIIGCSGTTKTSASETCWNNGNSEGTGGGFSKIWRRPKWQQGTPRGTPPNWGRAVGDVSGCADPNTGLEIIVHGERTVIGGTSGVAPFWAGLLAAIKAQPGFCTWKMYQQRAACFTQITQGNNGRWPGQICNGLGAPNGPMIGRLFS